MGIKEDEEFLRYVFEECYDELNLSELTIKKLAKIFRDLGIEMPRIYALGGGKEPKTSEDIFQELFCEYETQYELEYSGLDKLSRKNKENLIALEIQSVLKSVAVYLSTSVFPEIDKLGKRKKEYPHG